MYGITYNNKHSINDIGLTTISVNINEADKIKSYQTVPFMNGSYDFSLIHGDQAYEDRELTYVFRFRVRNKIDMNMKKQSITHWISKGCKSELRDDSLPGYYFSAECTDIKYELKNNRYCYVTVIFTAYPFKISTHLEGNIPWDDFCFETDVLQDTKFDINGALSVRIYNRSDCKITPVVICSSSMEITKDGITYAFKPGSSKDYRFKLNMEDNEMTIKGNGTIEFQFYAEVL